MVYILGFSSPYHDTAVCLVEDGKIVMAVEEERLNRVKHTGVIPELSLRTIFRDSKIKPSEIDAIAIAQLPINELRQNFMERYSFLKSTGYLHEYIRQSSFRDLSRSASYFNQLISLLKSLGVKTKQIINVEHHEAHAASAYYCSGFKKCLIGTMDWRGDLVSASVNIGNNGEIHRISESPYESSIGYIYSLFTRLLGFKWESDEGKVMSLSAFGDSNKFYSVMCQILKMPKTLTLPKLPSAIFPSSFLRQKTRYYAISSLLREENMIKSIILNEFKQEDIAAALQRRTEEVIVELIRLAIEHTRIKEICLAGGVFLNVKANKLIREGLGIKELFIQPAAGDAGTAIGAALRAYNILYSTKVPSRQMEHVYLGPSYTDEEIAQIIKDHRGMSFAYTLNPCEVAVERILKGGVVGWFQGKMEFGPRALGNRSIIADPRNKKIVERINAILKRREWFQPFAPSILDGYKNEYLERPCSSPFMIMAFDVQPEKISEVPAVVHMDGTTRPHIVMRSINAPYYDLIDKFRNETGVPLVLNTSFNIHNDPIVCSPQDAVVTLAKGGVDCLILGNYIVTRSESPRKN